MEQSLSVYPAANLIHYVSSEIQKMIIDPEKPEVLLSSDWKHIQKKAVLGVPELVNDLLNKHNSMKKLSEEEKSVIEQFMIPFFSCREKASFIPW